MIVHTNSFRYLWEVLENEEYSFLFKDFVVLDLGCNVGAFSLWMLPFAKEIYAIDKDQEPINLFNETIRANEYKNIKTYVCKLDAVNTLADFMSGHAIPSIDIMKIDIEGDELDVFEHENFPAQKINSIIGEHHYDGSRLERLIQRINELGYLYRELPNGHFIARKR